MNTAEIIALSQQYLMNTYNRLPMAPVKGRGCWVWDADGKKYLDFFSGLAVCNLGHSHPQTLHAIARQARRLLHVSNVFYIDHQAELAEWLVKHSSADKVFFCNSGAEANEAAVKLARKYARKVLKQDRYEIITMRQSFHGRTLAMITATGQEKFQKGFEPLMPGFQYAEFGDIASIERAVTAQTIAVMIEPVQGEGGVRIPPKGFFKELRDLCNQKGLLLILDEVQVGMGRLGTLFGYEQFDVTPDIFTLAKALGGGLPIGAMLAKDFVSVFEPGDHASTFGGTPFVTAVALATAKAIEPEVENAQKMGGYLKGVLEELKREVPLIQEIRSLGLIAGIDLKVEARPLVIQCLEAGLLVNAVQPKTIRLLPPLIIQKKEIDEGVKILRKVLHEAGSAEPV